MFFDLFQIESLSWVRCNHSVDKFFETSGKLSFEVFLYNIPIDFLSIFKEIFVQIIEP